MSSITEAKLAEIERALAAGTPGPMRPLARGGSLVSDDPAAAAAQLERDRAFLAGLKSPEELGPGGWYDGGALVFESCKQADAEMFAALHAAAPALVAAARSLLRIAAQPDLDGVRAWCERIVTGVGGLDDYNRYELACMDTQVDAVEWTVRCLANPDCEGSRHVLDAILAKRAERGEK